MIKRTIKCDRCSGSGKLNEKDLCPKCGGEGKIVERINLDGLTKQTKVLNEG